MSAIHVPIRALTADHIGKRVVFADGGTTVDGVLTSVWIGSRTPYGSDALNVYCNHLKVKTATGEFELSKPSLDFEVQFPGAIQAALAVNDEGGK